MKKLFSILMLISTMLLVFSCAPAHAQTSSVISIDTAGMPANVKEAIKQKMQADAVTQKIETVGKWAGMGREIGVAAKEGLTAVKDFAVDVSDTNVGRTVLFLIVWKVAGIDFVRIFVAILLMTVSIWLISRSYFRMIATRTLIEKTGWWIFGTKKYQPREIPDPILDGATNSWVAALHWLFLMILLAAAGLIGFAN